MASKLFSTDEDLRMAVVEALANHPHTAALHLRVGVMNAIVHLAGDVQALSDWHLAAEVAGGIVGIRGVVNRIAAPGAPSPGRIIHLDLP
jgi:osmotically-inducible protein OsmY